MLRRLLFLLAFSIPCASVPKPEPFLLHLILKTSDGRALQHGYKAGIDLQTGPITVITVKDWNGVELVAGDVVSLSSHDETVQATRLPGSPKLAWQPSGPQPTRFVLRKVDGPNGSPIATGDKVRFQLFGEKDTYLGSNAELVLAATPGPEQTWLVRRETFGNQATRKLYSQASMTSDPGKSKALFEAAFAQGAFDAMGTIGDMYLDGKFGSKDLEQAAASYRKGAEAGDPSSMYLYGVMLYYGKGVSENKAEGVRWEQNSARADYSNAADQLKKWGAPVPGVVAVAPAAPPPASPPVSRLRYTGGTMLLRDGSPAVFILEASGERYRILTRKYYEPGDYFWTGNEYGRYQVDEAWVDKARLESSNLQPADKKYRTCDVCDGEGCELEQMTSRRGGYDYVKDGAVYHVSEYDKPTYKRQKRCHGCGGQGWIPRS